jgi:hypothetical protein
MSSNNDAYTKLGFLASMMVATNFGNDTHKLWQRCLQMFRIMVGESLALVMAMKSQWAKGDIKF